MGNIEKLMQAGIIPGGMALSDADQEVINSLTDQEVAALISIKGKLTPEFTQKLQAGGAQRGAAFGIVF
jgi:hypothetical protein